MLHNQMSSVHAQSLKPVLLLLWAFLGVEITVSGLLFFILNSAQMDTVSMLAYCDLYETNISQKPDIYILFYQQAIS